MATHADAAVVSTGEDVCRTPREATQAATNDGESTGSANVSSTRPRRPSAVLPLSVRQSLNMLNASTGASVVLADQWRNTRCVVVFLRHLGCRLCAQLAAGIATLQPRLAAAGVELVGVSMGTVEEGQEWLRRTGWPGACYVAVV